MRGEGCFGCYVVWLALVGFIVILRFCHKNKGFEGKKEQDHNYSTFLVGPPHTLRCGHIALNTILIFLFLSLLYIFLFFMILYDP